MSWGDALKSAAVAVAGAVGKAPSGAKLTPEMVVADAGSGGQLAVAATLAAMRRAEADARASLKASLAAADDTLALAADLLGTALGVSVTQAKGAIDDAGRALGGLFQDELAQARASLDGAVSVLAHGALGAIKETRAWLAPTDDPKALPLAVRAANAGRVLGKVIDLLAIGAERELEGLPRLLEAPAAARREAADKALARARAACEAAAALVRTVLHDLLAAARGTADRAQTRLQDTEAKALAAARLEASHAATGSGPFAQRVHAILEQLPTRFTNAPLAEPVEGDDDAAPAAADLPAVEARGALRAARGLAVEVAGVYLAQCGLALQAVSDGIEMQAGVTVPRAAEALDPMIAASAERAREGLAKVKESLLEAGARLDGETASAVRHAAAATAKLRNEVAGLAALFEAAAAAPAADTLKPIAEAAIRLTNGPLPELGRRIDQAASGCRGALGVLGEVSAALDGAAPGGEANPDPALGAARDALGSATAAARDSLLPVLNTARVAADAALHCLRERLLAGLREVARLAPVPKGAA